MNATTSQARLDLAASNSNFRCISVKMIVAWFQVDWFATLAVVLLLSADPVTLATFGEEFRVQIPQLTGPYAYGQARGPEPFDLGTWPFSLETKQGAVNENVRRL
jgi:hypothetical protein